MALVQCKKCGAEISKKAIQCPSCESIEPFEEEILICQECECPIPSINDGICPRCGNPDLPLYR